MAMAPTRTDGKGHQCQSTPSTTKNGTAANEIHEGGPYLFFLPLRLAFLAFFLTLAFVHPVTAIFVV
jgi:hypothetical protein